MKTHEAISGLHDEASALAGVYTFPRLRMARGEGSWLFDTEGVRYLDMIAGLGVMALGHAHGPSIEAARRQLGLLTHCSNLYGNEPALVLAERLKRLSFAERVFFSNSGAESIEAALKFSRLLAARNRRPAQTRFVALSRSFHGRTLGALSVTHTEAYRKPFLPLVPSVTFVSPTDADEAVAAIDESVAGVIMEPIQGEGGVHSLDPGYAVAVRAACDRVGAALIFDEIQCGLGRTGRLFGYERLSVVPDIVCLAKPLGGGLPLGAVLVGADVAACLSPGQHGTTFGGGPVPCAMGLVVLDTVAEPAFLAEVRARGLALADGLATLSSRFSWLSGRRGEGLMQALVIAPDACLRHPPRDLVVRARSDHHLLISRAGTDSLRFLPPLTLSASELGEGLTRLEAMLVAQDRA